MALTKNEIKQYVQGLVLDDRGWNWTQWDDECHRLSVHVKYDQQLIDLEAPYQNKLKRLYQHYQDYYDQLRFGVSESFITATPEDAIADLKAMKDKFTRIALKWNTVKAEIRGRELGHFIRTPVGTDYYIDLDGGNDGSDGLTTGNAWLTLEQYTMNTIRSAGDNAYLRANTDEVLGAFVRLDEDGNEDSRISVIGCDSVVNDPWSDGSDVKPIIDCNAGANYLSINGDNFWHFERLVLKNTSGSSRGHCEFRNSEGTKMVSMEFRDGISSPGAYVTAGRIVELDACIFINNDEEGLEIDSGGVVLVNDGIFDAGVGGGNMGAVVKTGGQGFFITCDFGQTNSFTTIDVRAQEGGRAYLRNCNMDAGVDTLIEGFVFEEDKNQVKGDHVITTKSGICTRDTGVVRIGGATSSVKMEPDTDCGLYYPLCPSGLWHYPNEPWKIWTAAALTTITIYIRSLGVWGAYPTVNELYLEASYLDESAGGSRAIIVTDESPHVLIDETTWIPFDLTFTPLQEGFVYLNVYLKKFEANKGCYVDIKPVVT